MNQGELNEIVADHAEWLATAGAHGARADLSGADLTGADLTGVDLRSAILNGAKLSGAMLRHTKLTGAYLWGADLQGANLWYADLRSANLRGVNLRDAYLRSCSGNRAEVKSMSVIDVYPITYTADVLQIGCERHLISEWAQFDDDRIMKMNGSSAMRFWREWKDYIFMTIEKSPAVPTEHEEK